jgi:hypothetical protein
MSVILWAVSKAARFGRARGDATKVKTSEVDVAMTCRYEGR